MCFVLIEATLPVATKLCSGIHPGLNPLPNFISMSAIGELRKYGHVSAVCTSHEVERMQKLAEVSKEFLRTRAETFVRSNSQRPLIITLGADCTPLTTQEQVTKSWMQLRVRRKGRSCQDYVIQRWFSRITTEIWQYVSQTHWSWVTRARGLILRLPGFFMLGKELGHDSVLISHHCWDRAINSACDRHQRQLHRAFYEHSMHTKQAGEAHMQWLLSWYTSSGCILHDLQNAVKWSIWRFTEGKAARKCVSACESLRNAYDLLILKVSPWLAQVICFEDWEFQESNILWTMLNIEAEWVDMLVQLQVRYESGFLKVASAFSDREDTPQIIITCLVKLWKFRRFSESRWLTLGDACRALNASEIGGLGALASSIIDDPQSSIGLSAGYPIWTTE